MIRFDITETELYQRIDTHKSSWRSRAATRTQELESDPNKEIGGIWSEIKQVYMDLQGPKCGFCEKFVESERIESDVEHFRPKNGVKRWKVPRLLRDENITVKQPSSGTEPGYRLLAYHPLNYLSSCKTCNSSMKSNYFPIAGTRKSASKNPSEITGEKNYLIYPIGRLDDNPETLITFEGIIPQAKGTGFKRKRAMVTIAFFELAQRKDLLRERAQSIVLLYNVLERSESHTDEQERQNHKAFANKLTGDKAKHANCLRCFTKLWETDRGAADAMYQKTLTWLSTVSF